MVFDDSSLAFDDSPFASTTLRSCRIDEDRGFQGRERTRWTRHHSRDRRSIWAVGWPKMTKQTRAPLGGAAHGGTAVDETRAQQLALAIKAARRRLDAVALANQGLKRRIIAERLGLSLGRVHQMLVRAREDAEFLALHDAGGWPSSSPTCSTCGASVFSGSSSKPEGSPPRHRHAEASARDSQTADPLIGQVGGPCGRTLALLQKRLSDEDRKQLLADIRFAPAWVGHEMRRLAQDAEESTR